MPKKKTAADVVFDALIESISHHEYEPGDRLPAENTLAETYGVSRVTIRAALNKIAATGIIKPRVGGGWYVQKFSFSHLTDVASKFMIASVSDEDLSEYRNLIETSSIRALAGKKIQAADLRYLEACCEKLMPTGDPSDTQKIAVADYNFHRRICKMSGNTMFLYSYEMLYSLMVAYFEQRYLRSQADTNTQLDAETTCKAHRLIVQMIRSGNFEEAAHYVTLMNTASREDFLHYFRKL